MRILRPNLHQQLPPSPIRHGILLPLHATAASRILAEARAASALNHPHICTIHDVGDADGQSFIVMEHVEGKPLSEVIPSDGLSPLPTLRRSP